MNKIILGTIFVAIAVTLVGSPILVEAVEDLRAVKVRVDSDGNFKGIVFRTTDTIPSDGLAVSGGYAIPTSGDFIAVTSHPGILDSIKQGGNATNAVWHTHLVQASNSESCSNLAIDAISFEEPSTKMLIREGSSNILVRGIANGTAIYTNGPDVNSNPVEFTVGNPIAIESNSPRGPSLVESISFDLNVAIDGTTCIGDVINLEQIPGIIPEPK